MAAKPKKPSSFVLDPIALGITNKLSKTTKNNGTLETSGGLLLEGEHRGALIVRGGPLYVEQGAKLVGNVIVHGDVYMLGQFGEDSEKVSKINVIGTLHLASTAVVYGTISYKQIAMYDGAQMHGRIETMQEKVQDSGEAVTVRSEEATE